MTEQLKVWCSASRRRKNIMNTAGQGIRDGCVLRRQRTVPEAAETAGAAGIRQGIADTSLLKKPRTC